MPSTFYVSPVGTGNGLPASPASVSYAIASSNAGDTIFFLNGTYSLNLSLSKQLILEGMSLSGVLLQAPSNSTAATIQLNEGTSNTVIKNMKIAGKYSSQDYVADSANNNSAILITSTNANQISNLVFENLEIYGASHGIAFNAPTSNNILINNCTIRNNKGVGVRIATNVSTCNGFKISNCTIKENNGSAFATNPSEAYLPNCTNYSIEDSLIENNNRSTANHSHDLSIFGFNGNLSILRTNVKCNHQESKLINDPTNSSPTTGGHAIVINGVRATRYALGNLTLEDVNVTGTIIKGVLQILDYTTLGNVKLNNVNIKDAVHNVAGLTWTQLKVSHNDTTKFFNLGNTKLTSIEVASLVVNSQSVSQNVNAGNVEFYDNSNRLVLLNKNNSDDLVKISQQVIDKSILSTLGRVYTTNNWFVSPSGNASGDGHNSSLPCNFVYALNNCNAKSTINFAAGNYNFSSTAGGFYPFHTIPITKELTLLGAQADVSAVNEDGTMRNNGAESVINGPTNGSSVCFLVQADNVTIDGFKTVQSSGNNTREAFNIKAVPAGAGAMTTRSNIVIKNCIIQNLRTSGQSQAILFGESTNGSNNASNGDATWQNVEIANNYFDASVCGNGYRGLQHSTHFRIVNLTNFNVHHNKFVHSPNITSNRAIGVISYINAADRGPTYLNNYKVMNNIFNTPSNSAVGGFHDCDGNCEFSSNKFENCKYGIASCNFRQVGGKIQNNTFNVSEYAIAINDNAYATTNGSNVTISGNTFNDNAKNHIQCDSNDVELTGIFGNNTMSSCAGTLTTSTYRQFDNVNNPLLTRTTRTLSPSLPVQTTLSNHTAKPTVTISNTHPNSGDHFFTVGVADLRFTSGSGVAHALSTGQVGTKAKVTINCVDKFGNPITNFAGNKLTIKVKLDGLDNVNDLVYNVSKVDDVTGLKVGPIFTATRNQNGEHEFNLSSLSTYILFNPNPPSGAAGGDPHVATVDGEHTLLPNDWKLVKLYEKDDMKVVVKCEFIEHELVEKLHKLDEDRNVVPINKDLHKYVTDLTYMTEMSVLKNDKEVFKFDMLNDKVLLHEDEHVQLEKVEDDEGLYSLTHKRVYPKQELSSYLVHLNNNNVMKLQVDKFWDDINFVKLYLFDKEHKEEYRGEFFKHEESNRL